ncbi:OsmC family protein [Deinococcus sp. UYEF24]
MNIQVEVRQIGRSTAEGQARTHTVVIDRPLEKGGDDQGMMGGEYLLVALGGCFMSNLLAAIHARKADVQGVRLQISGTLGAAPSRFTDIEVLVSAQVSGQQAPDRDLLDKLIVIADRACISSNTLRPAVNLTFRVA